MFESPEGVRDAIRLFWIVYIFDSQFSMITGLPVAFQESDIDPSLPQLDDRFPYARAMLCYSKIASHVWAPVAGFEQTGMVLKLDAMSWLDWQISQWSGGIPDDLRFTHLDFSMSPDEMSLTQKRLRLMLYLRGNQLRLLLYRPVFYSTTSAMENRGYAQTVVEIAKDNIRTISELDKATDLYQTEQQSFHYYLLTALGVLFLAVSQSPVEFTRQVRDEFYLGLELIKRATRPSVPLQRLGRSIANLKKMTPKLEVLSPSHPAANPLANGNRKDGLAGDDAAPWNVGVDHGMNGSEVSYELMNLFEVAGGFGDAMMSKQEALIVNSIDGATGTTLESLAGLWRGSDPARGEGEFAKAMKDVF
jgi:hypothetical protein